MVMRGRPVWALVVCATLLMLTGCGTAANQASRPRTNKPPTTSSQGSSAPTIQTTPYPWAALSAYPPFAGSVTRGDACAASSQLDAATTSTPKIVQCWSGEIAGHSFVYAAFYTLDKQGYQLTVDGTTQIQETDGAPGLLYQFSGDYACTGSGAAAWMVAIDLATGKSYNPAFNKQEAEVADRYCASPNNPSVIASKYVIGIPARVPMK